MPWDEEEEFDLEVRGYRPERGSGVSYVRGSQDLLTPQFSSSLRRSRSHGAQPAPNISVYTSTRVEEESRSPSPRRGRASSRRREEDLLDRLEQADYDLGRARSRGRSDAGAISMQVALRDELALRDERALREERARRDVLEDRLYGLQRQYDERRRRDDERLAAADLRLRRYEEDRVRDIEWRSKSDRDEELWAKKAELRRLRDRIAATEADARFTSRVELEDLKREQKLREAELNRKEEREKILAEKEKEERVAKEERKRIKMEIELKEKEEEAERKAILAEFKVKEEEKKKAQEETAAKAVAEYEKKKMDKKKEEEDLKAKFKAEEEEAKRKAKEEHEKWKLKFELEEQEEKDKKKKKEAELEDEMRKRMSKFGFQENQIQAIIKPEDNKRVSVGALPSNPVVPYRSPTYVKINKEYIDIETLKYFALPWEYSEDRKYIIVLQELSTRETDYLFEHTRKLRSGGATVLIEDRGRDREGKPEYAFVRRRSKSRQGHSPRPVSLASLIFRH